MQEVLHSVFGTIVNAFVYRKLVVCLLSRPIPFCFFCQVFAAKFSLFPVRQPAEPNTKLICVFPQKSEAKARYPVSQCGNVVAVPGKCTLFPCVVCAAARSCAGGALRSVCEKNRQQFHAHRELVSCLVSRQIPSCFFGQAVAAKFPLFPVRRPTEPNTKLICGFSTNHKRLKQRPGVLSRNAVML